MGNKVDLRQPSNQPLLSDRCQPWICLLSRISAGFTPTQTTFYASASATTPRTRRLGLRALPRRGEEGSGKTAIFKRLITTREPTVFAFGHTFDDYPWHHHDLQAQAGVPEERRYIHSWQYLILLGLAKILLNVDQSQPWGEEAFEALGDIEAFVVDSYGSRDPDLTQLFQPEKQLRFKGALKLGVASIEGESVLVKELPLHVQEVNRSMQRAVLAA